jgi:hypothetical protein
MIVCGRKINIQGRIIKIARLDADRYQFLEDPTPLVNSLRKSGVKIDLFTFMQKLPETSPRYDYPMEWDNLAALPVSTFANWWTQQIGSKARNKAKQAAKNGVTTREVPFDDELARGIWEIYNECQVRQGKPNAHYGRTTEWVHAAEATYLDSSIFIGAFLGNKLIGFAKLVTDETRMQAGLMNIVSMVQHRDKAPTNALIAQAVRTCAEHKIGYLVYSSFAYGKKQRDSLSDFKERNGFQRIDLPRYYIPLTCTGWLAFRLGLHRELVDLVPESIGAKLRELRKAWYRRKFQPATEAS